MKKFLFLMIASCGIAFGSLAQQSQVGSMTATNALTLDTVTNTATKNLSTGKVKTDGSISFVLTVTKISGTVGGTATLMGSNDGTNWAGIATAYTITDATQTKSFDSDKTKYLYYRIACVGTGTMSASVKAQYYAKLQ